MITTHPQKNDVLRVKHRRTLESRLRYLERKMTAAQTAGKEVTIFQMQEVAAVKNVLLMADRAVEVRAERDKAVRALRRAYWIGPSVGAGLTLGLVALGLWAS